MSDPIYPKRQWPAGIQQASVPANINSLRDEALSVAALGVANDESSPDDGDVWIVGSAPTGAFAAFEEHDIALYRGGWHGWAPVANVRKVVNDVAKVFDGTEWIDDPAAGGGGGGSGVVESIVAGTGISVDDTDPAHPVVSATGSGSGDVTGPASSTADRIAVFDGTTGKAIKDGGRTIASLRAPAIQSVTSSATVTPTFADDMVIITAQAAALTLANPTGTAINGLGIVIRIKDNGTARGISYGSQYRAIGLTLPTTTVVGKTTYLAMIYNATDTTWDVVAVGTQA